MPSLQEGQISQRGRGGDEPAHGPSYALELGRGTARYLYRSEPWPKTTGETKASV